MGMGTKSEPCYMRGKLKLSLVKSITCDLMTRLALVHACDFYPLQLWTFTEGKVTSLPRTGYSLICCISGNSRGWTSLTV